MKLNTNIRYFFQKKVRSDIRNGSLCIFKYLNLVGTIVNNGPETEGFLKILTAIT